MPTPDEVLVAVTYVQAFSENDEEILETITSVLTSDKLAGSLTEIIQVLSLILATKMDVPDTVPETERIDLIMKLVREAYYE